MKGNVRMTLTGDVIKDGASGESIEFHSILITVRVALELIRCMQ